MDGLRLVTRMTLCKVVEWSVAEVERDLRGATLDLLQCIIGGRPPVVVREVGLDEGGIKLVRLVAEQLAEVIVPDTCSAVFATVYTRTLRDEYDR